MAFTTWRVCSERLKWIQDVLFQKERKKYFNKFLKKDSASTKNATKQAVKLLTDYCKEKGLPDSDFENFNAK